MNLPGILPLTRLIVRRLEWSATLPFNVTRIISYSLLCKNMTELSQSTESMALWDTTIRDMKLTDDLQVRMDGDNEWLVIAKS